MNLGTISRNLGQWFIARRLVVIWTSVASLSLSPKFAIIVTIPESAIPLLVLAMSGRFMFVDGELGGAAGSKAYFMRWAALWCLLTADSALGGRWSLLRDPRRKLVDHRVLKALFNNRRIYIANFAIFKIATFWSYHLHLREKLWRFSFTKTSRFFWLVVRMCDHRLQCMHSCMHSCSACSMHEGRGYRYTFQRSRVASSPEVPKVTWWKIATFLLKWPELPYSL